MKNKALLYAIVIFQMAIIGLIAFSKGYTRITGRKILVKVIPVDPRSLFRGDYVILTYDFSQVNLKKHGLEDKDVIRGDYLFLTMKKGQEGFWDMENVSLELPVISESEERIVLRGLVSNDARHRRKANLIFGTESFFVPEGEGKYIEGYREKKKLSAEISVDKFGRAAVSRLFIAGKEVSFR